MEDFASPLMKNPIMSMAASGADEDTCEDACSICLEPFNTQDPATFTTCKHEFHLHCIRQWSHRSKECPICCQLLALKDPVRMGTKNVGNKGNKKGNTKKEKKPDKRKVSISPPLMPFEREMREATVNDVFTRLGGLESPIHMERALPSKEEELGEGSEGKREDVTQSHRPTKKVRRDAEEGPSVPSDFFEGFEARLKTFIVAAFSKLEAKIDASLSRLEAAIDQLREEVHKGLL